MKTSGSFIETISHHWQFIAPHVSAPHNDRELEKHIAFLDELLDMIGDDENHPLMSLVDLISSNIEAYENNRYKQAMGSGLDALKFLMKTHDIVQSDLPEIGSQGVVSEILNGKRQLNRGQIERLSKRFGVDPATFFDE